MKSFFAIIVSGFACAGVAKADSCSALNAEPVTVNTGSDGGGNNGGGSNGGGGGGSGGGGFVPNLYGCIDMQTYEDHCSIEYRRLAVKRSQMTISKRAGLDCSASEACISLEGDVLCYNPSTDYFHIEDGTQGNFGTGDYLLPDGQTGNLFNGPFPTLSSSTAAGGASRTAVRSSNVAASTRPASENDAADATTLVDSRTRSSSPTTTPSPAPATTTSSDATASPNSGIEMRGHGGLVGAVVGMAGFLAL